MGYLICDDLITPIEEAISKEKIEELFKDKEFKGKGKIYKCGFTVNIKNCPFYNRNLSEA